MKLSSNERREAVDWIIHRNFGSAIHGDDRDEIPDDASDFFYHLQAFHGGARSLRAQLEDLSDDALRDKVACQYDAHEQEQALVREGLARLAEEERQAEIRQEKAARREFQSRAGSCPKAKGGIAEAAASLRTGGRTWKEAVKVLELQPYRTKDRRFEVYAAKGRIWQKELAGSGKPKSVTFDSFLRRYWALTILRR